MKWNPVTTWKRRALLFLADNPVQVSMLVTDRHKQINKFLNQKCEHWFDVWYVSYYYTYFIIIGVKKKLVKLSQYKDCVVLLVLG